MAPALVHAATSLQSEPPLSSAQLSRALRAASPGLTAAAVAHSFRGGTSDHWRHFLLALADRPDQWVPWAALCVEVGRSDRQCRDIVHRAERRVGGYPPYVRASRTDSHVGGSVEVWMPATAAALIRLLADGESLMRIRLLLA
jgi:hypothetical protein